MVKVILLGIVALTITLFAIRPVVYGQTSTTTPTPTRTTTAPTSPPSTGLGGF